MLIAEDITVVIPVYNTPPDLLIGCVRSVSELGYQFLLVDDHSDNSFTLDILYNTYKDNTVKSKYRRSSSGAVHTGMSLVKTSFAARCDSDDLLLGVPVINRLDFDVCFSPIANYRWKPVGSLSKYIYSAGPASHGTILRTELAQSIWDRQFGVDVDDDVLFGLRLWYKIEKDTLVHVLSKNSIYHYNKDANPKSKSNFHRSVGFTPVSNLPILIGLMISYEQLPRADALKILDLYNLHYAVVRK